jgi:hypothetical protein
MFNFHVLVLAGYQKVHGSTGDSWRTFWRNLGLPVFTECCGPAHRNSPARIRTGLLASARSGKSIDIRRSRAADLQSTRHDLPPLPRGRRQIGGYAVMAGGRASCDFDDPCIAHEFHLFYR